MAIFGMGLFFPIFYIQLDALRHGVDSNFAFYSVCPFVVQKKYLLTSYICALPSV